MKPTNEQRIKDLEAINKRLKGLYHDADHKEPMDHAACTRYSERYKANVGTIEKLKHPSQDRPDGYYWVKYRGWEVAHFLRSSWGRVGDDCPYFDDDFDEIGERIPESTTSTDCPH